MLFMTYDYSEDKLVQETTANYFGVNLDIKPFIPLIIITAEILVAFVRYFAPMVLETI